MNRYLLGSIAAAQLLVSPATHAALIAYEPFDYATGALAGTSGGTGWSSAWTQTNATASVTSPGYAYTDSMANSLAAAGNRASLSGSNAGAFRSPTSSPDTTGTTLYVSFLAQASGTSYFGLSLFEGTGSENLFLGAPGGTNGGAKWGIDSPGVVNKTVSAFDANALSLLVYRIDFASTTTISLFVNPTLGSEPASADLTTTRTAFTWDRIRIQGNNTNGVDEIRMATTYADVAPVPEPSAAIMLLSGTGVLLGFRRRSV